eukprot:superscaffoldBa00001985_g12751
MRASSAPSSSRSEPAMDTRVAELNIQVPVDSRKTQPHLVHNQIIPDELLVSLTSTVCNRKTLGHTAHHRHCKGCGIRRPDAVWHHPLGRKKYKYFLEQPTSLTGAGRKPSGRLEVVQLMRMMDDMLEKAGVDQQSQELTELSQMEGLLELVQTEQNIYNIVFHELIRQVSVGCAERGQLLAKLRQRYQSLLERIPRRLKALHTEAVAQRALDRRLTEEIHRIKTSIQQLSTELSRIRDHDSFVSHQAERAHQQLADALDQTHTNSDVVQGYHQLYELQRGRLETQLLQMTEERDCWSQRTFCLALKVISVKKLELVKRLHFNGQSWFKTAEHCSIYLASKDTEDLNIIMELTDYWREQLTAFMSQLKKTEHAQCDQISAIQQGITKWLAFCTTQNNTETEKMLDKVQEFITSLSNFTDCENQRLMEEVNSIQMAQTRWMLDLLLLMVSDHSEDQSQEQDHQYITNISLQKLDEDAKVLAEKLGFFSKYITSSCQLIVEEQILQNPHQIEGENEMDECRKLQRDCTDWVETSLILLSGVEGGSVELCVRQADPTSSSDVPVSPTDSLESLVNKEVSAEPVADNEAKEVKDEIEAELKETEELVVSPATDEAQKAFSDLTTVGLLQQELHESELQVQSAEQRALKAEEALQAALEKIKDLERQLHDQSSLEPKSSEEKKKTPPPSPPPVTDPAPPKKTTSEAKSSSSTKKTKKR